MSSVLFFYILIVKCSVQAGNCVEEKEWVDVLAKICRTNEHRLEKYHPSAFVNGSWIW